MATSPPSKDQRGRARPDPRGGGRGERYAARRRSERRRTRALVAAHARTHLSPQQRAREPLPPVAAPGGAPARLGLALAWIAGSVAVHALVVVAGVVLGGGDDGRREAIRQEVKIEVRETKVVPPPPPVEKPPEPEKPVVKPKVAKVEAPPPPKEPPPQQAKAPPPRVVGLSLESTVEGGGDGPSFAVGNTRLGETAARAANPREVAPVTTPDAPIAPPSPNQTASRIPVAGVKYTQVKRRRPNQPPYPETLKAQGLEADVPVMINIDAAGKVTSVKILREAPYPEFNEAARRAAMAEEYEPATRDGVPIPSTLSFTYRFRLDEEP